MVVKSCAVDAILPKFLYNTSSPNKMSPVTFRMVRKSPYIPSWSPLFCNYSQYYTINCNSVVGIFLPRIRSWGYSNTSESAIRLRNPHSNVLKLFDLLLKCLPLQLGALIAIYNLDQTWPSKYKYGQPCSFFFVPFLASGSLCLFGRSLLLWLVDRFPKNSHVSHITNLASSY